MECQKASQNAAVENHSSKITAEQYLNKIDKGIFRCILEQLDYLGGIRDREDHVAAKDHSDYDKYGSNDEVINTDPFLFPDQHIAYDGADKDAYSCADRICAYRMSENIYCWIHVINQKQLPQIRGNCSFKSDLSVDHQADIAAAAAQTTQATHTPSMKKMIAE